MADEPVVQDPGTGDTGTPGFVDTLPEDLRAHEAFKGFTDVGGLAKAYAETVGKVPVVPESPDKYAVEGFDAKAVKEFAEVAHKAGMTNEQAAEALKYVQGREAAERAAADAELQSSVSALQKEWPGEMYKANLAVAQRAYKAFMTPELEAFLSKTGMDNHGEMVKAFFKIGSAMSEDTLHAGNTNIPEPKGMNRDEFGRPMLKFPDMAHLSQ